MPVRPKRATGPGQIFAADVAQCVARIAMAGAGSPLEVRRRHHQIKVRRLRRAALDQFAEHESLHLWERGIGSSIGHESADACRHLVTSYSAQDRVRAA